MPDRSAVDVAAFRAAFPYHREREVEFSDIDLLQHVNNVRYAVWAETLRVTYFADVFATRIDGTTGVIIARHDMHYEAQLAYRERVVVGCRVARCPACTCSPRNPRACPTAMCAPGWKKPWRSSTSFANMGWRTR